MTKEALTLALEALENGMKFVWTDPEREAGFVAIDAIKEALAQPEQELVATYTCGICGVSMQMERPWVSLTREEINSALSKYQNWYEFAAHLENILKEKNQ